MSSPDTTSLVPALEGHRLGLLALVADFTVPLVLSVLAAWRSAIGCDDVQVLGHTAQRLTLVDAAPRNLSPNQVVVLASEALALLAVGANGTKRLLAGASLKVGHDGCRDVLRDVVVATKFASPKERNALADWFNGGPALVGVSEGAGYGSDVLFSSACMALAGPPLDRRPNRSNNPFRLLHTP